MTTHILKPIIAVALTAAGTAAVVGFQTADMDAPVAPSTGGTAAGPTGSTGATGSTGSTGAGSTGTVASPTTAPASATEAPAETAAATTVPTATTTPTTTTAPTAASDQLYADGTWTGEAVDEPWGTFQVEVTVADGQIVDVSLLESPQDRHSSRINQQAVPILTQEAIAAQSASIDMLSGATWTSESYITSLQAALDDAQQAQVAGS